MQCVFASDRKDDRKSCSLIRLHLTYLLTCSCPGGLGLVSSPHIANRDRIFGNTLDSVHDESVFVPIWILVVDADRN